jgi:preprotein translocase subunit SecB
MADKESGNGASQTTGEAGAATEQQLPPTVNVLTQYIKDLSFENPSAPRSLAPQPTGPKIEIGVNVNAKPLSDDSFEVDLTIEAKAREMGKDKEAGAVIFSTDLTYGGVFRIQNVPQESIHPVVLIECPRLLFPFARQVIAEATRNGGFPPLMIDPIDFSALYRQRLAQSGPAPEASVSPT